MHYDIDYSWKPLTTGFITRIVEAHTSLSYLHMEYEGFRKISASIQRTGRGNISFSALGRGRANEMMDELRKTPGSTSFLGLPPSKYDE